MGGRAATKRITAAVLVLVLGLVVWFAFYAWQQSRVPKRASVAAIERRYSKQVKRLTEYAFNYDHVFDSADHPFGENTKQLFDDLSIVDATVNSSNSVGHTGIQIKEPTTSSVGTTCWFRRLPSPGTAVVNMWRGGGREIAEYSGAILDQRGTERSYMMKFDLSKMDEAER